MARPVSQDVSPVQEKILRVLASMEEKGIAASLAEIARSLSLAGTNSVKRTLQKMEHKGVVTFHGGGQLGRTMYARLTTKGRAYLGIGGLPLLGSIPAGPLAEAVAAADDFVNIPEFLLYQSGDFLLRVSGDSMIGDGILPGDLVCLRPEVQWHPGQIVAVQVGDEYEATLKRIYVDQHRRRVILKASNPAYRDIEVTDRDVRIAGVYRWLIRLPKQNTP